jgi:hypothetical protein
MQLLAGTIALHACPPPSAPEFRRLYQFSSRPVVFEKHASEWPACSRWNLDWLERAHGERFLPSKGMSVAAWIARMREATTRGDIEYLSVPLRTVPELVTDVRLLRYHPLDCLSRSELWVGPAGTRTPLHCDFSETLFWQIIGRKRLQLYRREAAAHFVPFQDYAFYRDYIPESAAQKTDSRGGDLERLLAEETVKPDHDFILEPGDLLYLPFGWFHRVTSLEPSFSVSSRWVTAAMLARRLPHLMTLGLRAALGWVPKPA